MRSKELDTLLGQLGLIDKDAVIFIDEDYRLNELLHFDTKKKLDLIKPDAMYVFNKQPLILFFDLTNTKDAERENDIHKKVWSFDNSPVIFIIKSGEIHVYNALNYVKKDNRLQEILFKTEDERNNLFSFWNLQSGKWLQEESIKKKTQKRVNERLFQNIKDVRNALIDKNNDRSGSILNSLILRLIFIRYLIDRDVKIDERYIFGKDLSSKRLCFSNLIKDKKKLGELFTILNNRFNGVLFKDMNIVLNNAQANELSQIFKGEIPEEGTLFYGKDFYFDIFDFSIIPVETISGIYESLIDPETRKLQAAVYTPSFLVDYILNDTVDKHLENSQTSDCKIFEVAVGSGIFLVQSLRRMIEKEIKLNGNANKKEFGEKIRNIAKKNLFGIDINEEALKITCFSIYIALLDYIEPKDIGKYKFPNLLNKNLFSANFFDTEHPYNKIIISKKPNFILGNPPWKNGSEDTIHVKYLKDNAIEDIISDYQLAQSFLLRTKDFSKSQPLCSLIVTSKAIHNNTATLFKNKFLTDFYLKKCFDLSCVRRLIFEKASNPAMVLQYQYANKKSTLNNIVCHSSLKYNLFVRNYKMLTFEKNDIKEIKQEYFIKYNWLFKVALYGNALDFHYIKKLSDNIFLLKSYLEENNINYGKGIEMGTPKKNFPFLKNLYLVEKNSFNQYYIDNSKIRKLNKNDVFVKAGRDLSLFEGKKIILGKRTKNQSDIKNAIALKNIAFTENFYGITSNNDNFLYPIFALINSNLYLYYQYLTSANWGIFNPELNLNEYLLFPFIEPDEKTEFKLISLVNQFLFLFEEYYKQETRSESLPKYKKILSKINSIINNLYGITGYEKDLIDYVLKVSRYQFQESKQKLLDFTDGENGPRCRKLVLEKYADVYIQEFEKIYDDEFLQVEIYPLKHFIAMKFKLLKNKPKKQFVYPDDKTEQKIFEIFANNLSISQKTYTTDFVENLFIQKDIKGFEENSFYIIKPNEYKCWHRAMAWYDVAEFKVKIEGAELKWLK